MKGPGTSVCRGPRPRTRRAPPPGRILRPAHDPRRRGERRPRATADPGGGVRTGRTRTGPAGDPRPGRRGAAAHRRDTGRRVDRPAGVGGASLVGGARLRRPVRSAARTAPGPAALGHRRRHAGRPVAHRGPCGARGRRRARRRRAARSSRTPGKGAEGPLRRRGGPAAGQRGLRARRGRPGTGALGPRPGPFRGADPRPRAHRRTLRPPPAAPHRHRHRHRHRRRLPPPQLLPVLPRPRRRSLRRLLLHPTPQRPLGTQAHPLAARRTPPRGTAPPARNQPNATLGHRHRHRAPTPAHGPSRGPGTRRVPPFPRAMPGFVPFARHDAGNDVEPPEVIRHERDPAHTAVPGLGDGGVRADRHPRRGSRRADRRPPHRPGEPLHREPGRGQHLPRRRRALRHGAALAGHRSHDRLRLHAGPYPRFLAGPSLGRRLPHRWRPARAAHHRGHHPDRRRQVRRRVLARRRDGEPRLLPGRPRLRHPRRADRHCPHRGAALHLPRDRQGQRAAERGPGTAQDEREQGRDPGRPHRTHRDHRPRLLPGHRPLHGPHGHPLQPALHRVRHLGRRHRHRRLARRTRRCLCPLRHHPEPHGRGDDRAVLRRRRGRAAQSARGGRPVLRHRAGTGPRAVGGAAARRTRARRWHGAAPYVLLLAVPLVPRAQRRWRRRRPLLRLGPARPHGEGVHVLPELVAVGHLPHPGPAARAARAARGTGHGPLGGRGRRGRRLAAQVGLRPGRDERDERRPGHPVPDHRLPGGPAEGVRGTGLPRTAEERGRGAARRQPGHRPGGQRRVHRARFRPVRQGPAAGQDGRLGLPPRRLRHPGVRPRRRHARPDGPRPRP
ncbi:hypothetical protein SGPA1_41045 [Streptomyces misionensis JCM 4497]